MINKIFNSNSKTSAKFVHPGDTVIYVIIFLYMASFKSCLYIAYSYMRLTPHRELQSNWEIFQFILCVIFVNIVLIPIIYYISVILVKILRKIRALFK